MNISWDRAILFSSVILVGSLLYGSIPPHPRVRKMIAEGKISEPYYLKNQRQLWEQGVNAPWAASALQEQRAAKPFAAIRSLGPAMPPTGSYNALLILVDFSDNSSQVAGTAFDALIFNDAAGTLRDYYQAVSYGNLDVVTANLPSTIGWKRAPHTYDYYVNEENGLGLESYPNNAQKLVEDVVQAVDGIVDFSQYDNDGDGYVDALFVIHAGSGAEFTGENTDIKSHAWVTKTKQLLDGVYVWRYSMEPEYWETPGDMTIGVYAHEMGHTVFGLRDLYDRDEVSPSEGLGVWSLMAGGSWNGDLGNSPAFPDAWSHAQMGYVIPTNVTANIDEQSITNIETSPEIFRLWSAGIVGGQYFLVQNRQQISYDAALPGSGLLIFHVDELVGSDQNDNEWYPGYTSYGHYLVALEQADGLWELEQRLNRGDAGDPFPGSTGNTTFYAASTPDSRDYDFNDTYVSISNISSSGPAMTADLLPNTPHDPFTRITNGPVVSDGGDSRGHSWGDFDNDGDLDLFVANFNGQNNFLYVNNGNGTFTKVTTDPVVSDGGYSNGCSWGDIDNDGDLDLFVANDGNNFLYSNNGDGTFTKLTTGAVVSGGRFSSGSSWGDIDNDGDLDLFVANGWGDEGNFLYANNGNGTFNSVITGSVVTDGGMSFGSAWGDYDNDGDLDLFVANSGENFLYANHGDGTFTRITTGSVVTDGGNSVGGSWGDYDNDGDLDLFVANGNNQDNFLYANNGDGSFIKVTTGPVVSDGGYSSGSSWGDFDNDGDLDLVVANHGGQYNFLYANNGDGTFTKITDGPVVTDGGNSTGSSWGDFDNDGDLDLFVANFSGNNFLYANSGNGYHWINVRLVGRQTNVSAIGAKVRLKATIGGSPGWQLREISGQTGYVSQNSLNAEFGLRDATVIDSIRIEWPSGVVSDTANVVVDQFLTITEPPPTIIPTFTKVTTGPVVSDGGESIGSAWGDFDNDGDLDLFVANVGNNFLYTNLGDGTFTNVTTGPVVSDGGESAGGSWGDYDNDGDLDLFVVNGGNRFLYTNLGDGTFTNVTTDPVVTDRGGLASSAWGDYDNDGDLDLFVANNDGNNFLYANNGDGTFTKVSTGPVVSDGGTSIGASWGDYDNDGDLDLFVINYDEDNFFYINDGDGTFTKVTTGTVVSDGGSSVGGSWGDYDNDGDLDLFVANGGEVSENNFLYQNNGDGTFTDVTTGPVVTDGGISIGSSWGDYDNDGDLDLFVANAYQNNFLYTNNGDGTFIRVTTGTVVSWGGVSFGSAWADYDSDGDLDLFVANVENQNNFLYANNGNSNHWINLKLAGGQSNTSAIGAKVRVKATIGGSPVWQLNEISSQTGLGGQNSLNAEFGLGDATSIDTVIVEWPSGLVQELTSVTPNQFLTITEPDLISPTPPIGLIATAGDEQVTLVWLSNTEKDLSHYAVYMSTTADFVPILEDSVALVYKPDTVVTVGELINGTTYYFRLTAIDTTLNESDFSSEVSATPLDLTSPAAPQNLVAEAGDGQMTLKWQPNSETDLAHYVVYRSTTTGFDPIPADSATQVSKPDTVVTIGELINGTTYYFRVTAVDTNDNESDFSDEVDATPTFLGIANRNLGIPTEFALHQNYPNPFNPTTRLEFDLPKQVDVSLKAYDIVGREVTTIVNELMNPGYHRAVWDGRDNRGQQVPSGIYIARLVTPEYSKTMKMLLLK